MLRFADTGSTDYHCYCYDGFYGRNCTLYDPCFSAPCQNNGHCRNLSVTEYSCRCRPGFHGVNCQLYNPCADSPCLHGGMCNSIDGQFVCDCEQGYYGSVALSLNVRIYTTWNVSWNSEWNCHHNWSVCIVRRRCERADPCSLRSTAGGSQTPCGPHAVACHNFSDTSYKCICEPGQWLPYSVQSSNFEYQQHQRQNEYAY